jgi:hypothetical protein
VTDDLIMMDNEIALVNLKDEKVGFTESFTHNPRSNFLYLKPYS